MDYVKVLIFALIICIPNMLIGAFSLEYILFYATVSTLALIPYVGHATFVITVIFGMLQVINGLTLGIPIFESQITAFLETPLTAIKMTDDYLDWKVVALAFLYLILSLYMYVLVRNTKAFTLITKFYCFIFFLMFLLVPCSVFAPNIQPYSPFQYAYYMLFGVDVDDITIGERGEAEKLEGVEPVRKLILILGESQSSFSNSGVDKEVAPFIYSMVDKGEAVILNNVQQSGISTYVSHVQIFESASLKNISQPHVPLYEAAKDNRNPWMVTSRSWAWKNLYKHGYEFNRFDCGDINPKCGFISSVEDMLLVEGKIKEILELDEYFLVWQINGSHSPLEDRNIHPYTVENSQYLSTVKYTDYVIQQLFNYIDDDVWVLFVADHNFERSNKKPTVASFIAKKGADISKYKHLEFAPLTHFDFIKTIFNLLGVKYNYDDAFNMLEEKIPVKRERETYHSLNANKVSISTH